MKKRYKVLLEALNRIEVRGAENINLLLTCIKLLEAMIREEGENVQD